MSTSTLTPSLPVPAPARPDVLPAGKRILLVEGDGFTRLVLLLRLRLAGFRVDFTSNGDLGLSKLQACQPDILLLDLKLCGLSGIELIKAARAEPAFRDRPVYAFTRVDRINRTMRKHLAPLAVNVVDKNVVSREDLVQLFVSTFMAKEVVPQPPGAPVREKERLVDLSSLNVMQEIIKDIRQECELLPKQPESSARADYFAKLLSQVRSVVCCADVARFPNLARQARAIQNLLSEVSKKPPADGEAANSVVTSAVDVMGRIAAKPGASQKLSAYSAVVFDEQAPSNTALQAALGRAGFKPVCFTDGVGVREHLAAQRTDLIIANVLLPETHSLTAAEIKRLPLHANTPIIFVREPNKRASRDQELPTRGARLDWHPLMVAEVVVKALNLVQSAPNDPPVAPVSAAPVAPQLAPRAKTATAPALPLAPGADDGFVFFRRDPLTESPTTAPARVEPASGNGDRVAELAAQKPVIPVDGHQAADRALEDLPPFDWRTEVQPTQPESPNGDQTAESATALAAAGDAGGISPLTANEFSPSPASAAEDSSVAPAYQNDSMNNQAQVASMEATPFNIGAHPIRAIKPGQQADLAAQARQGELALLQARSQIEQRDKIIEALRQELTSVTGAQARPSDQGSVLKVAQERCAELEQEVSTLRQALEGLNAGGDQPAAASETEARLRQQLEAATAEGLEHAAASQQAQVRCAELDQQCNALRQAQEEMASRLAEEQRVSAEAANRVKELEAQPVPVTRPVPGAPASDLELQVRQGVAALAKATAELAQERGQRQRSEQRAAELSSRLQSLHDDLRRTLQAQHDDLARIKTLEEEHRQMAQDLEQRNSDLEQQQAERRLADEQCAKANELAAQLHKDVAFLEEANKGNEASRQDLQTRLEASLGAVRESEARLQQEKAERQRLSDQLDSLTGKAGDRTERDLQLSKLESALQTAEADRQRQEAELAYARNDAQSASHVARALRVNLRRQVREPVDDLVQSAQQLLELELGEQQKKLAQTVLENVMLVQTRLREPQAAQAGSPDSNGASDNT